MRIDVEIKRFCSHCKRKSLQSYLTHHAYDEGQGSSWDGDPDTAIEPAVYFLFACQICDEVLLYYFDPIDEIEFGTFFPWKRGGVEFMAWDETEIKRRLQRVWPPRKAAKQDSPDQGSVLDPSTSEPVRECYEIAVQVQSISNDLYAVQLRKTLEAVCKDLGASERLPSGKRAMLWQQIDELEKQNTVGHLISKAAHELKQISNSGAHYSEEGVDEVDIRKLERLLALITTYVYGNKVSSESTMRN